MHRIPVLVVSLLIASGFAVPTSVYAATILTESFGTGSSANDISNWEEQGTDSDSDALAQSPSGSGEDTASPDGGRFAKIGEDQWICREINATGFSSLELSYYWRGDNDAESSDRGYVEYKTSGNCDSGSSWTQLQNHNLDTDNSWSTQSVFSLPSALSNSSFNLRFRNDASAGDEYFRVDGILLTGTDATDTTAPVISGLTNDPIVRTTKTWTWSANETATFRYVIDQNPTGTPSGEYNATVSASQNIGDGTYYIHVQARDTAGNESAVVTVSVVLDNTSPTLAEVTPIPTPANDTTPSYTFSSSEAGAITYAGGCASGTSAASVGNNAITLTLLAEGTYNACTITVTDAAGNSSSALTISAFTIDLTAPVITLNGSNPMALGTGDTYTEEGASATDAVDGSVTVSLSGSVDTNTPGTYLITYDATDTAGNAASVQRAVNVSDDDAPVISGIPADIIAEAVDALGAIISWASPTANDNVDGSVSVACAPSAGSAFAIATTIVACSALDSAGNTAAASFSVTVEDTTAPTLDIIPADQTLEAANISGLVGTFSVTASDAVDGDLSSSVSCDHLSGDVYPLGATTVTCGVTDAHGNSTSAMATITVVDTTRPVVTLIGEAELIADQNGSFSDLGATAYDSVDGDLPVTATPSGSVATEGQFTITYTATDSSGNQSIPVVRTVTVRPQSGGGQSSGGEVLGAATQSDNTEPAANTSTETATNTDAAEDGAVLGASCSALPHYIGHTSAISNPTSVTFLQEFLNTEMGLTLEVNGTYDAATIAAVKAFQLKYAQEILAPWIPFGGAIDRPTGIVYKTTQRMINMILCPGRTIEMPALP